MYPSFVSMPIFIYILWNQNLFESFLRWIRCQREISLLKACLFTGVVWINFIEFCFQSLARPPRNFTKVTPRESLGVIQYLRGQEGVGRWSVESPCLATWPKYIYYVGCPQLFAWGGRWPKLGKIWSTFLLNDR